MFVSGDVKKVGKVMELVIANNHSRWQELLGHLGQSHIWKTFHSQKDC
jgi:hypothetical protein